MAHEHDFRAALYEVFDSRQRRANARVVGHDAVFDGYVEIDAHEHALASDVNALDSLDVGHKETPHQSVSINGTC